MSGHDLEVWGTVAFVVVLVLATVIAWFAKRYRSESMEEIAKQWGWDFFPVGDVEVEQEAKRLPLFQRGWARHLTNALAGARDEAPMHLFDYEFAVGAGRRTRTYRQTVAACLLKTSQSVPTFELRPEHLLDKFSALFGSHDINFTTHPEFSRLYRLSGTDESGLRRRFRLELLHELASQPGWSMEGEGEWVLMYRANRLVDPDDLEAFRREAAHLARLLAQGS